jgi:hypothetical protein
MQCWPMTKVYTVKPTDFAAQMKALSEAGYHYFTRTIVRLLLHDGPAAFKTNHDYF